MSNRRLLKLVNYDDPILRNPTEPVQFPLSDLDKQIIEDMKYSIHPEQLKAAGAPWEKASGMAANQWGINKSIFLFCPYGDHKFDLTVVINPSYEFIPDKEEIAWEGCFSVPLATGKIKRSNKIRVKYQNEKGRVIEKNLSGWEARVWQHENDHLNGFLYDDPRTGKCLDKREFTSYDAVEEFYATIEPE